MHEQKRREGHRQRWLGPSPLLRSRRTAALAGLLGACLWGLLPASPRAARAAAPTSASAAMRAVNGEVPVRAALLVDPVAGPPRTAGRLAVALDVAPGWHIYSQRSPARPQGTSVALTGQAVEVAAVTFPPAASFAQFDGTPAEGHGGNVLLAAPWRLVGDGLSEARIDAHIELLACKVLCVPGRLALSVPIARAAAPVDAADPVLARLATLGENWQARAPQEASGAPAAAPEVAPAARVAAPTVANEGALGLAEALLFAFLGGLVLNVMPCVLPVLVMKAAGLALLAADVRARRRHALGYTAGAVGAMWLLAGFAIFARTAGQAVGWGFQMQQPGYLAALSCALTLFAAHTFGAFTLTVPVGALAERHAAASGVRQSILEGVLAVLVATPCSAPLLGAAMAFALSAPIAVQLLAFAAVGLGLAAPFALLATWPQLSRLLPRPGPWMHAVKALLGLTLLGTLGWLVWLYAEVAGADALFALIVLLWLAAAGAVGLGLATARAPERAPAGLAALLLALFAAGLWLLAAQPAGHAPAQTAGASGPLTGSSAGREPWSDAAVAQRLSAGTPVLVEFTADWCVTCKYNERILASPAAQDALARHRAVVLYADWTRPDPAILAALERAGRAGIPLTLLYSPARPTEPTRLPEVLSVAKLEAALAALPAAR